MAGFFDDVLKGFLGSDYLKDYRHASKTFRSAGYANAPRLKYLFHVFFNINTAEIPGLTTLFGARDSSRISVLTKSVQLPNYTFDVETMNQYNRKRNVQTKINYEPVEIDFHDDNSDIVRSLWFAYYNYFYKDPSQAYGGNQSTQSTNSNAGSGGLGSFLSGLLPGVLPVDFNGALGSGDQSSSISSPSLAGDQNRRDIYAPTPTSQDWGYIGEGVGGAKNKPQFFRDITIYGFNQHSFVSYTLVNPIITDFRHDTYDYSAGGDTMTNSMTIRYESVKYGSGAIGTSQVPGFANPEHYDEEPSALSRPGSTNSFLGQGGILDAGVGAFEDLSQGNILGAVVKGARAVKTFRDIEDPGAVFTEEAISETKKVITDGTAVNAIKNGFQFATPGDEVNAGLTSGPAPIESRTLDGSGVTSLGAIGPGNNATLAEVQAFQEANPGSFIVQSNGQNIGTNN